MVRLASLLRVVKVCLVSNSFAVLGILLGAALMASLSGCGSSSASTTATSKTIISIAVSAASGTMTVGTTEQLAATATYSDGSTGSVSASATWSSASPSVATVSATGLVTAMAPGSSVVSATLNGVSATSTITVAAAAQTLAAVVVSPASVSLVTGGTQSFVATAEYSDGTTAVVTGSATWSSSSPAVATVSATGVVTAVAAGSAMVTATLDGMSGSAAVTVNNPAATLVSLAVTPSSPSITAGATQQLGAIGTCSDNTTATLTAQAVWSSSATGVATVSGGLVTGVAAGSATVTATLNGVSGAAAVTVNAKTVSSIAITPSTVDVAVGATQQLTATATYTDQTSANVTSTVTWSTANSAVAGISSSGLVTPIASGATTVSATLGGVNASSPLVVSIAPGSGVTLPTWQGTSQRDGLNDAEQTLTPANVSSKTFGKLFSYTTDGYSYAEPLLVSNVTINSAQHNVLYVATEHDSVYAFDADSYGTGQPLWQTSLLNAGETPILNGTILPYQGVTSTPVIDPTTNTMYVVSTQTSSSGGATFRLNALDITTGAQKFGGPVTITASVPGTNDQAVNGTVSLTASCVQRAALLLANGYIYIGFGSCQSGWLLAYDATTLSQVGVFNSSPDLNGEGTYKGAGGIWMGGGGPAADSSGNIYVTTGNGPWNGTNAYGDTVLKFSPTLSTVEDLFTPDVYAYLNCQDTDLASGGLTLLPGGTQLLAGGKSGVMYLLNTDPGSLAGEQANDAGAAQEIDFNQGLADLYTSTCTDSSGTYSLSHNSDEIFGTGASFNGAVYLGATPTAADTPGGIRQFTYSGGLLVPGTETTPSVQQGSYGTTPFISANGTNDGIVWMIDHGAPIQNSSGSAPSAAILRAYDASNLSDELYDSTQNAADAAGYGIKFTSPIVANGKVYVSTGHDLTTAASAQGEIDVYGLN